MTPEFQMAIASAGVGRAPGLHVCSARGASVGTSGDGSATVAILGSDGAGRRASDLANAFTRGSRDPTQCRVDDVAAVLLDHAANRVSVMAAPIGLRQVYWTVEGNELALGSSPGQLPGPAGRAREIRPEALFHYVYFHMLPGPLSIYEGVSKLPGGHCLAWDGREVQVTRYWRPRFDDRAAVAEAEAARRLHEVLDAAVAKALAGSATAGTFLSGGLDSSTVAGLAARHRPGIPTVTMGFDAEGYDEVEYARIASRRFGTRPLEYYVTPDDVGRTLPTLAAAFPEPFGNSSAAAAYHCARVAREHGLGLLLAGDGGDELFGGNDRYAKQLVFERYARIPKPLRLGLLEPILRGAGRATRRFPIGKALSYIDQANVPLPDRLQTYNFLHRHEAVDVFSPELLASARQALPLQMLREEYGAPATDDVVNRMLFLDWRFTLHDNDLVKVNTMCQLAGLDVAYPMLDQSVVDFSLGLPAAWKVRKGELRWFYKRAMQGFLPDEILHKTKHGFGLPFGVWTRTHEGLRKLSTDALESLARRNFFRPQFLRDALRLHGEGHASYYGELVWILTVLELWLRAKAPAARLE